MVLASRIRVFIGIGLLFNCVTAGAQDQFTKDVSPLVDCLQGVARYSKQKNFFRVGNSTPAIVLPGKRNGGDGLYFYANGTAYFAKIAPSAVDETYTSYRFSTTVPGDDLWINVDLHSPRGPKGFPGHGEGAVREDHEPIVKHYEPVLRFDSDTVFRVPDSLSLKALSESIASSISTMLAFYQSQLDHRSWVEAHRTPGSAEPGPPGPPPSVDWTKYEAALAACDHLSGDSDGIIHAAIQKVRAVDQSEMRGSPGTPLSEIPVTLPPT